MTVKIILASLAMLAMPAFGQDMHLQVHTTSHHFHERTNGKQWNEVNAGAALRLQLDPAWAVQAGGYRNSIDRWTAYAVADWTPLRQGPFAAGVFGGVRTGYGKGAQAAGGALARWQGEKASVTLRLAPKSNTTGSAVVALELGWKL
jgi:hypothetical protein